MIQGKEKFWFDYSMYLTKILYFRNNETTGSSNMMGSESAQTLDNSNSAAESNSPPQNKVGFSKSKDEKKKSSSFHPKK